VTPSTLHPELEPLRGLVGIWRGSGAGSYPTIDPFEYTEEVTFGHVGKPFLAYGQKTRDAGSGLPLHVETGYWRPTADGGLEVVIVQPTGITEVLVGRLEAGPGSDVVTDLRSASVVTTPTAKSVTEVHRRFELRGDELTYELAMAAVGQPLTHHLRATLQRVVDPD
jgi:hypothetical protein